MSVASAYALRNRRSGRAFARMWDAILVHRARSRLADNNMARAMEGWVEPVIRDGAVVAERRRFDNRLSMAMLTRLDRLAESAIGEEADLLRALSEDFEDYLELLEADGDEDQFLEDRMPAALDEEEAPDFEPDDFDALAAAVGCSDWRDVHFGDVPVDGLDPERRSQWSAEDWVRSARSYYLSWLDMMKEGGKALPPGPECPAAFDRIRSDILARIRAGGADEPPDPAPAEAGEADEGQASTSSTSSPNRHERRRRAKLAKKARRGRRSEA